MISFWRSVPGLMLAALAGCGGGGGGEPPEQPVLTIPLTTAIANYVNQTRSSPISIAGTITSGGQSVSVTGSGTASEATGSGNFEGQSALRKSTSVTGTLVANGVSVPLSDSGQAYFDTNYKPLGGTTALGYCVTVSATALPTTARIGDNGPWYTQDCYPSSSKVAKLGTVTTSYAVEPDSATSVLLRLIGRATDTAGNSIPLLSTFRVTTAGAITRLEETTSFAVGGDSLSLTISYR